MFQKMMQWVRATLLRLLGQENTDLNIPGHGDTDCHMGAHV